MTESIYAATLRILAEQRVVTDKNEEVIQSKFEEKLKKVRDLSVDEQIDALLDHNEAT